jgi:hypothetical protein
MTTPDHIAQTLVETLAERAFSNRASVSIYLSPPRVTVLSAVGIIRRNIWSEPQALQCLHMTMPFKLRQEANYATSLLALR